MFLPLLLVRDYGPWAFAAFAAPNVIGAGAFAWWFAKPGASEAFVERHRAMIRLFATVTIAFHGVFLGWLAWTMPSSTTEPVVFWGALGSGILLVSAVVRALGLGRRAALCAVVTWLVSLGTLFWLSLNRQSLPPSDAFGGVDLTGLAWLTPVCAFGFAFCPLLDPTFHHARQSMNAREAKAAFSIGFGVFFLAMISLTLLYAPVLDPMLVGFGGGTNAWIIGAVTLHLGAQAAFTIAVHRRAVDRTRVGWKATLPILIVALGAAPIAIETGLSRGAFGGGEVVYRSFMGAYGLVFPAYVLIAHLAGNSRARTPYRLALGAVIVAAPAFWMGFIESEELWLAPGLLIVMACAVWTRAHRPTGTPASHTSP